MDTEDAGAWIEIRNSLGSFAADCVGSPQRGSRAWKLQQAMLAHARVVSSERFGVPAVAALFHLTSAHLQYSQLAAQPDPDLAMRVAPHLRAAYEGLSFLRCLQYAGVFKSREDQFWHSGKLHELSTATVHVYCAYRDGLWP